MNVRFIKSALLLLFGSLALSFFCKLDKSNSNKDMVILTATAIGVVNGVNVVCGGIGHTTIVDDDGNSRKVDCIRLSFSNGAPAVNAIEGLVFEIGDQKWKVVSIKRGTGVKKGKIHLVQVL